MGNGSKGRAADDAALAVFIGIYEYIEGYGFEHAGGGEHTHIAFMQAVECDIFAVSDII